MFVPLSQFDFGAQVSGPRASSLVRAVAALPVCVSAVLLVLGGSLRIHQIGFAFAVVGLLALLFFKQHIVRMSSDPNFVRSTRTNPTVVTLLSASLLLAALHTWPIASEIATRACN